MMILIWRGLDVIILYYEMLEYYARSWWVIGLQQSPITSFVDDTGTAVPRARIECSAEHR